MSESILDRVRNVPFVNNHSTVVPAYGLVQVTGWAFRGQDVAILEATRPTTTGQADLYAINSGRPVPSGQRGLCTFDLPHLLLYDSGLTAPALGATFGPQADSFKAKPGPVYYVALGAPVEGVVLVGPAKPQSYIGKCGSTVAAMSGSTPGSGTMTIWEFNASGVLVATTRTITAYNTSSGVVAANRFLHTQQERQTGRHLINFEDCA